MATTPANSTARPDLITIEGLTKVFYTDKIETRALSGVHLRIARGEYVAMSGPSGCGKSTLLSILGLLDTPTEGRYTLNGREVAQLTFSERSRNLWHSRECDRTAYGSKVRSAGG